MIAADLARVKNQNNVIVSKQEREKQRGLINYQHSKSNQCFLSSSDPASPLKCLLHIHIINTNAL